MIRRMLQKTGRSLLLSALLCAGLNADVAFAEPSLKRKVFENCSAVKEEVIKLTAEQRREFIDYLGRVVSLRDSAEIVLGDASQSTPLPHGFDGAFGGASDLDMWRIFQPNRDTEAKRCAVQVLGLLVPDSAVVLDKIVLLASEPRNSEELQEGVETATWTILRSLTSNPEFKLPTSIVESLVGTLGKSEERSADRHPAPQFAVRKIH